MTYRTSDNFAISQLKNKKKKEEKEIKCTRNRKRVLLTCSNF